MGGKKGGEGMCTVKKDYLQGRGKKTKGGGASDDAAAAFDKGKIFDSDVELRSSGRRVLDRGEYKEFKHCSYCKNMMVWRKTWERCWDEVKFCRKLSKVEDKREQAHAPLKLPMDLQEQGAYEAALALHQEALERYTKKMDEAFKALERPTNATDPTP